MRLGDHCNKIGSGATPRGGKEAYLDAGPFSLIRSQNVRNERFERAGLAFISDDQARALANVDVQTGDVLVNITGDSVARVCQVDPGILPARVNQHVAIVRPNGRTLDATFLRYWFVARDTQNHLLALASAGATRPALTKSMLENLRVPAPDVTRQRRIAATLSALDDKIELNRRMNETLEASARALFRDWFVDFGPTRAKAESRPAYLASELWSLFPDRLDDSDVPEGWGWSTIGAEVEVAGGSTPSTKDPSLWDGGIAWTTPKDLSGLGSPILSSTARTISDAGLRTISSGLLPVGTVLMSSRAPVGYLAIAQIPVAVNQGYIAMRCNKRISNWTAYLWAKENMDAIIQNANGSTFQEISKANFRPLRILVAGEEIRRRFNTAVAPMFEEIIANDLESRTLAETRDMLLPKLMSGAIRVREAEAFVGDHL